MTFLIHTNVVAELRKGARANAHVRVWFAALDPESIVLSVLTIGELRRGIENVRHRDPASARALDRWLSRVVADYAERLVGVDDAVADQWGRLGSPDPVPVIDGLLAATALVHNFVLATRNVKDVARTGVRYVNPFDPA